MAEAVNVRYAKTHLSRLLERVRGGAVIMLAKDGKLVAAAGPVRQHQAGPGARIVGADPQGRSLAGLGTTGLLCGSLSRRLQA